MYLEYLSSQRELQQDNWSLQSPTFGENSQLRVLGYFDEYTATNGNKYYILFCSECELDHELFGSGVFRSTKHHLLGGRLPCGCSDTPKWSMDQWQIKAERKAAEMGYTFNNFVGGWKGQRTKISLTCDKHGEWQSGRLEDFLGKGCGCPSCSMHRQQECYINLVRDGDIAVAIKFGVAIDSTYRIKTQRSGCIYSIYQHSVFKFTSVGDCRAAEQKCKDSFACGILSKEEMSDGYTETTSLDNLPQVIEIFEKYGGMLC